MCSSYLVALPSDVSRSKPLVKKTYEMVFKAMVDLFQEGLRRGGRADRQRALAIAAMCAADWSRLARSGILGWRIPCAKPP